MIKYYNLCNLKNLSSSQPKRRKQNLYTNEERTDLIIAKKFNTEVEIKKHLINSTHRKPYQRLPRINHT